MIDFHCHILPGIDDGAKDIAESIAMAQQAALHGITHVVATPHYMERHYTLGREQVLSATEVLQKHLDQEGIPLKVLPGQEVHLDEYTPRLLKEKKVCTINDQGKYVLVELPEMDFPHFTERLLFEIMLLGITPIIAHPERNKAITQSSSLLQNLVEKGVLAQVTAGSFGGLFGETAAKTALKLAKSRLLHVLGSDAHAPGPLFGELSKARDCIKQSVKDEHYEVFLGNAASEIIQGKMLLPPELLPLKENFSLANLFRFW